MYLISRAEAVAAGIPVYFTGKPCPKGHVDFRQVADRKCSQCRRDCVRARRHSNPKINEKHAAWKKNRIASDPEYAAKERERVRKRQQRHREETDNAYGKAYKRNNKDKVRSATRNRRARKKALGGEHTAADIQDILRLQGYRCGYCKTDIRNSFHVDHITPIAKGGRNDRRNLQCLCGPCNQTKWAHDPIDYARSIGLLL